MGIIHHKYQADRKEPYQRVVLITMLICEALRQGHHHQLGPGQPGHVIWPCVCLTIYLFSLCSGDSLVCDDSKSCKFFHPFHLYNTYKFSCNYGSRVLLKRLQLLEFKTYVFMLQTQTFQHKTIQKRRHEEKISFLLLMEHVSFFF